MLIKEQGTPVEPRDDNFHSLGYTSAEQLEEFMPKEQGEINKHGGQLCRDALANAFHQRHLLDSDVLPRT